MKRIHLTEEHKENISLANKGKTHEEIYMNKVIECDGDYWHSYPTGNELDHIRTKELIEKGFNVLRLWEFEIKKLDIESFKDKLYGENIK